MSVYDGEGECISVYIRMYHSEGECIILDICLSVCQCMMVKESVLVYTLEYIIAKGNVSFYICLSVCQCMMREGECISVYIRMYHSEGECIILYMS